MIKKNLLLLLMVILLAACSLRSTASGTGKPIKVPTPAADKGVVTGKLYSIKSKSPMPSMGVYLGDYVQLTPGPSYMISIREQGSPHTQTDADGNFVIADVPPGKYPILAWTPFSSYVIPTDETEKQEMVVEVIAGKVTDLGTIKINWP